MLEKMSHLNQRLLVGISLVCFILFVIYFSPYPYFRPVFALSTAAIIGGAVWEYYQMAKAKGVKPLESLGILGTIIYVIATFWTVQSDSSFFFPGIILEILILLGFFYFFLKEGHPFLDLAVTFFGFIYLTIPLTFLININYFFPSDAHQDGRWWLVFLILVSKVTDTGGFFFGRHFGRTKLTPQISPKKTWEGAIGGVISALLCAVIYLFATDYLVGSSVYKLNYWIILGLAFIISFFSQVGDLSESMLKRDAGIKDSNQLPGLGGVLDVVDSLVFTTPIIYIFLKLAYA